MIEFAALFIFALVNPWLNYGAQIFFIEILTVAFCFFGFWIGGLVLFMGLISFGLYIIYFILSLFINWPRSLISLGLNKTVNLNATALNQIDI